MNVPPEAATAAARVLRCWQSGEVTTRLSPSAAIRAAELALEAAAPLIAAAERERIANAEPDWQWANPIADRYVIRSPRESGGCFLRCTACDADLFSVGEMDLWEFALDAKRHDLEKHADLLGGDQP